MRSRLKTVSLQLLAISLLTAASISISGLSPATAQQYDEPKCRKYAEAGDHQLAAECYYDYADAENGPFSYGEDKYQNAFDLLIYAEQEARLAGDLYIAGRSLRFRGNLMAFRFDDPAQGSALAEEGALTLLQVDPYTRFDDEVLRLRRFRLYQEIGFAYNNAGNHAKEAGDLERALEMFVTGGRHVATTYDPPEQAAADLITESNGRRYELGAPGQHGVNFEAALTVAGDLEEHRQFVEILVEFLDINLGLIKAGFEGLNYGFDSQSHNSDLRAALAADPSLMPPVRSALDDAFDFGVGAATGATEYGHLTLMDDVGVGYQQLADTATNSEDHLLAAELYRLSAEAKIAGYSKHTLSRDFLRAAAYQYASAATAARNGEDLALSEELWALGAVTFEMHLEENEIDRSIFTTRSSRLDASYYGNAGRAAQDRGDCDSADLWFQKQADALALYDGEAHEPQTCRPPLVTPTPVAVDEPTATPTSSAPSNPDAALDDLINTFGRMTREVAEERIKVEIRGNLEDLAEWLGQQMQDYLEDSVDFLDEVYDSLPEFSWEEQEEAGDIPDKVEEQPDDPGGPGLSFDDLIDAMTKKVPIPSSVDSESGEELYNLVTAMLWAEDPDTGRYTRTRASGGEIIEIRKADGTAVKTGVFVTPDGRVLYSTDGTNYYSNLTDAIDPSVYTRGLETYRSVTGYLWQRGFEGKLNDDTAQLINDVSQEVLDEFRREMSAASASSAPEDVYGELKDPFKDIKGIGGDPYQALEGKATKSAHDYIEGKLWDPVKDKLKGKRDEWLWAAAEKALDSSIEFEARQNFKFLLKEYQDLGNDALAAWEDIKKKAGLDLFELTGISKAAAGSGEFMVSAVQQMGKGLQDSDFGVRAKTYIQLRQQGSTPQAIWDETRRGAIADLEFSTGTVTRSGVESTMAQQGIPPEVHLGLSFSLYEQAYQRFKLAEELGRKP